MKLIIVETERFAREAADIIARRIEAKPSGPIGFATGTTTIPVHAALAGLISERRIDTSQLAVFNVDEYLGIDPLSPKTCLSRMQEQLYRHIRPKNIIRFRADAADPEEDGRRVLGELAFAGGLEMQVLGIGTDGHIGFNDPGTPWEKDIAIQKFSPESRKVKAAFFEGIERVPERGITLGIRATMQARSIVLLASGSSKAAIIRKTLEGAVTPDVPSSVLQLHPDLTVVLDENSALGLKD